MHCAGEMARQLATGDQVVKMSQAIEGFKTSLPDIAARDVLEHFDEYEIGIGNAQEKERRVGQSILTTACGMRRVLAHMCSASAHCGWTWQLRGMQQHTSPQ
jgi:hypothetical protein